MVHACLHDRQQTQEALEARLTEAKGLCEAIALRVREAHIVRVREISPASFIGKGKIEELAEIVAARAIVLTVMDCKLSPLQQRNLEKMLGCKVIDRTALILEIFGARARTAEGKLQVELASLTYQKSRLVRSWAHLERQRGGFGFMGGPGESQIEIDRRLIGERIDKIKRQLASAVRTRGLHRKRRKAAPFPVVALVGYTNAGKSTLFNRLTGASVMAKDMLFATLDPTLRALKLPSGTKVMLADTVGFIADLPTELIAAFRATLEEVLEADVIVHVRDASTPACDEQKADVMGVMKNLFGKNGVTVPMIEVMNKMDVVEENRHPHPPAGAGSSLSLIEGEAQTIPADRLRGEGDTKNAIPLSALTGEGIDTLLKKIDEALQAEAPQTYRITLPPEDGKTYAWLRANAEVFSSKILKNGQHEMKVALSATQLTSLSTKNATLNIHPVS